MKRKYGVSSHGKQTASTCPASNISNTSMSTSSKEGQFKAIKTEEESSSWNCNPEMEFSNTSMSTSFTSKEEQSSEEQVMAIKKEGDA